MQTEEVNTFKHTLLVKKSYNSYSIPNYSSSLVHGHLADKASTVTYVDIEVEELLCHATNDDFQLYQTI